MSRLKIYESCNHDALGDQLGQIDSLPRDYWKPSNVKNLDWRKRAQTRAQVLLVIEDILDRNLPEVCDEKKYQLLLLFYDYMNTTTILTQGGAIDSFEDIHAAMTVPCSRNGL